MNLHAHPELLDKLAAAHALGTLRGGARRRFETLARQSAAVRAAALVWQERLAAMTELQPAVVPSPHVWTRIHNLLQAQQGLAAARAGQPAALTALRRSRGWWRGAAWTGAFATLAAVAVVVRLGGEADSLAGRLAQSEQAGQQLAARLQAAPQIQYVAVLADDKAAASVLVTFDPRHNSLTLKRLGGFQEGPDQSLELWALPPAGGPKSLGVLGGGAVIKLTAAEAAVKEVPALAISLEPRGGAPAGSGPTGPVLFKGALLQTPV